MKRLIIICLACAGILTVACQKSPVPEEEFVDAELLALQARTPRPLLDLNGTIWTKSAAETCENLDERGILIPGDSSPIVGTRSPYMPHLYYSFKNGTVTVYGRLSIPYGNNQTRADFWLKTNLGEGGAVGNYSLDEATMTFRSNALDSSAKGNDYKIYVLNSGEFELLGPSPFKDHHYVMMQLRPANSDELASLANALSADDPAIDTYIQKMFDVVNEYANGDSVMAKVLRDMIQTELDIFFKKNNWAFCG